MLENSLKGCAMPLWGAFKAVVTRSNRVRLIKLDGRKLLLCNDLRFYFLCCLENRCIKPVNTRGKSRGNDSSGEGFYVSVLLSLSALQAGTDRN
jgi:hypothetical protein